MRTDRLRTHHRDERFAVLLLRLPVFFLGQNLLVVELRVAGIDDHVGLEVEHPLELAHGHVQKEADARRQSFEEPNVGDRSC